MGIAAAAEIRRALDGRLELEARRRLEQVLAKTEQWILPAATVLVLRVIQVLEYAKTADAMQMLETLAKEVFDDRLSQEVKASLDRLKHGPRAGAAKPLDLNVSAFRVKASDLLKEYAANAVAADRKYKGRVIEVTGKFSSAQKMVVVGYIVQIVGDDAGELNSSFVQCMLQQGAEEDIRKVLPGQRITMQGTCDGSPLPGQVKLSKCIVVK